VTQQEYQQRLGKMAFASLPVADAAAAWIALDLSLLQATNFF
jgi:hypothetical protein